MGDLKNWKTITESQYPWEREALDFIRRRFPDHEPYRAWSNFEFISDDGSVNEVDLLVFTPQGFFLIEIKSQPGRLVGDAGSWTWDFEGKRKTEDNPLYLANLKAKRLRSVLQRQKVFQKKGPIPFIEAVVFCSALDLQCELQGTARTRICLRDRDREGDLPARPGIMAALMRRECEGLDPFPKGEHNRPTAKLVSQAMEQAGVRPRDRRCKVSDYVLNKIISEGPGYQDWEATHVQLSNSKRRVRLYLTRTGATEEDRKTIARAALREFNILETLQHPGILRTYGFTEHELGPALIFEFDPLSIRLDHFIAQTKGSLTADTKLGLIRQIAEVVRFAHEKKVVHRALSPQSILVTNPESSVPRIKVFNWQAGFRDGGSSSATGHGVSGTSHVERLVEDASTAYMAPEAISDPDSSGEHLDIFSLGAIAYHIFTGQPPAANGLELGNLLRETKGLQISSVLNGAGENLQFLIQFSTHPEVLSRIDSVPDFLDCLDQVEDELTTPENKYVEDPTRAQKGDVLPGNFIVEKRLGQGACSVALLVKRGDEEFCLKAASTPEHNSRLKNEAEVLQKLRHQHIVEYCDTLQIGERTCILMRQAGKETLGQRLRKEGRLHIDLLQRFGEDLIEIVKYLEEQGIPHRDIKPDNIGVGPVGRGDKLHIILFDFSLSRALPDNIRAGTKGYLDPLLSLRKPPLWDLHAERYAAAATLYELTTGSLPTWGDEKSDPSQLNCEATIHPESFDANLRDGLTKFFQKAFRRDPSKRFDNAEVMLRDWRQCFEGIEKPGSLSDHENVEELRGLLAQATFETAIHELGLGTRATNALDRSNILTVKDLLLAPTKKLHKLRGVGNKTRREIIAAYRILQERLGLPPKGPIIRAEKESEAEITPQDQANLSIDLLAQRITRVGSREESSTHRVLMALLGLDPEFTNTWPSQSDVARYLGVTRARIGQQCATFQERWGKQPSLTPLRTEIADSLKAFGGVMTLGELAETLLVARGSVEDEPRRTQLAAAVIRAAVEVERSKDEPRFLVRRNEIHVLIALAPEMADYALQLGKEADILAAEDPLAAPTRTLQRLREIQLPPQAVPLSESRLIRLAAAASQTAAVSSRQELYPRGMDAARALRLSQGALLGVPALTVADIRERVIGRYPQAAPLPDRPELDALLRLIGLDSEWDSTVKGGSYVTRSQTTRTITSTSRPPSRFATSLGPFEFEDITPDIAAARQFEEKLQRAIREGSFLALLTPPKYYKQACDELLRRFPVELADFEGLFIDALREVAQSLKVNWDLVLQTDAAPGRCDWDKLLMLVRRAMPLVEKNLASTQKTVLMTYAGMLARYDQMDLLERLRDRVGRRDGISGLWLLIPGDQQALLEGKAIPILAAGQRARIPDSWLRNEHRANGSKVTSFEAQNP